MLQPDTLRFLSQLKRNNNKPWFDAHKEKYLAAKSDFENLIQQIISGYGKSDADIGLLKVKDCVFRIYRDVRFSKNKNPYKNYFAAEIHKGGKKVYYPGFYISIEPGDHSFCGGGLWHPEGDYLKNVRQEIDYNFEAFRSILEAKKFRSLLGSLEQYDKLTRPPKGYDESNPAIEFLKLKSFIADVRLSDEDLISKDLVKKILNIFTAMKPFVDFLSSAME